MVQQVTVNWDAAGGAGGVTLINFLDTATVEGMAERVQLWMTQLRPALANTTSARAALTVRQFDTNEGGLTGEVTLLTQPNITGNGGTNAVPNAAQGLIQYRTGIVVNGRFLRGRHYIPGMASGMQSPAGELTSTATTALSTAGGLLLNTGEFCIWHKPTGPANGVAHPATSATGWSEFAVQRRRRQ